jgi:hypothetical protein
MCSLETTFRALRCCTNPPNASYNHITSPLMYTASVVDLPDVDELLSSRARNLIRQLLCCKRLPCRLDDVHLVSRAGCPCGKILETGGTREFEDEMLGAETET